jgi:hypothetical protein
MPAHHYRITVDKLDKLDALDPGEEGLQSISFFASTPTNLFAEVNQLHDRLGCSALRATRLAIACCLLAEESAVPHPSPSLVIPTEA